MSCKCRSPLEVFNGVCGVCLKSLKGVVHNNHGVIVEDKSKEVELPEYVKLKSVDGRISICLRLDGSTYFRDAGCWSVNYIRVNGRLKVNAPVGMLSHLHGMGLVKCTRKEWRISNDGYVNENDENIGRSV